MKIYEKNIETTMDDSQKLDKPNSWKKIQKSIQKEEKKINIWQSLAKTVQSPEYKKMEKFHKEFYTNFENFLQDNIKNKDSQDFNYFLTIPCFELEKWEPMLIKNFSKFKNIDSPNKPGIKLIESSPTYILIAHGGESTKLPIKLEDNEYVIMNCNPNTVSWNYLMPMFHLYYINETKSGIFKDSDKIKIIEESLNIPSDLGVDLLKIRN